MQIKMSMRLLQGLDWLGIGVDRLSLLDPQLKVEKMTKHIDSEARWRARS